MAATGRPARQRAELRRPLSPRWPAVTLRRQLVVSFVVLTVATVALVGGISYSATVNTFHREMDNTLASTAALIAAGARAVPPPPNHPPAHRGDGDRDGDDATVSVVQLISPDGTVTSSRGPAAPLPMSVQQRAAVVGRPGGPGLFSNAASDGTDYRTYLLPRPDGRGAVLVAQDTAQIRRALAATAVNTMAIGLGIALLAVLAGWWIARRITRRLALLTAAAEAVASTGDLTVPVEAGGRDEVGRLADSMRGMLDQLAQSRDAQRRLVQDAGHELRTPLTSLRTNATVLRRADELSGEDRERLLDDVDSELSELTTLVNEVVELATDSYADEPAQPTALRDVLDSAAERVRRRTGRTIVVRADETVVCVQPRAMERAVGNLLENAVKFDPVGRAAVEVEGADGTVVVCDRGPGVPEDELDRIFDRFHRSAASRGLPGSGLGLAIVREITLRHGGRVWAAPRLGGGLVVTLALPADRLIRS